MVGLKATWPLLCPLRHIFFVPTLFPGILVVTAAVIAVAKLVYSNNLKVSNAICRSVLCLHTINEIDFGFSDVEPNIMLAQLQTTTNQVWSSHGFGSQNQLCTFVGGILHEFTSSPIKILGTWSIISFNYLLLG
jgi:hypothetical protein